MAKDLLHCEHLYGFASRMWICVCICKSAFELKICKERETENLLLEIILVDVDVIGRGTFKRTTYRTGGHREFRSVPPT